MCVRNWLHEYFQRESFVVSRLKSTDIGIYYSFILSQCGKIFIFCHKIFLNTQYNPPK